MALLEGHRISADLDIFSPSFDDPEAVERMLGEAHPDAVTTLMSPRTLYLQIEGKTVSLFGYSYPLVAPLLQPDYSLLPFASREDITAMKLAAITSRGSRKDFIDLWLLITGGWSLADCLELFRQKFTTRDIGHVVRSLTYFDDANEEPPLRMLVDIEWDSVKRDFAGWVTDLVSAEGP